jgi:hypothetical protein
MNGLGGLFASEGNPERMKRTLEKTLVIVATLSCCAIAEAQQVTKIYSIANPIGAQVSLSSMWVADSNNFAVEPLSPLPYTVSDDGMIDFAVRVIPRDGITRTTEVFYQTDLGVSSYTISMAAPLETSGSGQPGMPPHDKHAYPNPATDQCTIDIDIKLYPNAEVDLVTEAGMRVIGIAQPRGDKLVLDTHMLANGRYTILVSSSGLVVHKEEVVVRH